MPLIVLEIHGLQVSKSIKLKYSEIIDIYLYPKDFFKINEEINTEIKKLNLSDRDTNSYQTPNFFCFKVGNNKFSYLFGKFPIDIYLKEEEIRKSIFNLIDPFLRINTFIFNFFISISRIFIYERRGISYKLLRVIELNIHINKNREDITLFKNEGYCKEMERLLERVRQSDLLQEIIRLFYEFAAAKETFWIETHISFYWNYLEHFTNLYANKINRNLLINQGRFEDLKSQISEVINRTICDLDPIPFNMVLFNNELNRLLNELNSKISLPLEQSEWRNLKRTIKEEVRNLIREGEILIEGYNAERICDVIIKNIQNFPPIKDLIQIVLNHLNYSLYPSEKRIIDLMHFARNYIYHRSTDLNSLYVEILERFEEINQFSYNDLINLLEKFEKLIKKITSKALQSNLISNTHETGSVKVHGFHPSKHGGITSREFFVNKLKKIIQNYSQEKVYFNLLRFTLRIINTYEHDFGNIQSIEGYCYNIRNQQYIQFKLEFKNKFHARGKFLGSIGSPEIYEFYINLGNNLINFQAILKFNEIINMSFISNNHDVYIHILEYWIEREKAFENHPFLLENLI